MIELSPLKPFHPLPTPHGEVPAEAKARELLSEAVGMNSTEVYLVPWQSGVKIRYRIGRVWRDSGWPPGQDAGDLLIGLKNMARMNIGRAHHFQEGWIRFQNKNIWIALQRGIEGETVSMRIFESNEAGPSD